MRMIARRLLWSAPALVLAVAVAACRPPGVPAPAEEPPWFEDVTEQSGIDFVHNAGPLPKDRYFLPQIIGSGAALFDFDGDGRLDLYLIQNGGPDGPKNRLFRQGPDGRFVDQNSPPALKSQ